MKPERKAELFVDWEKLWVRPYSKREVDPYTRTRVILMNGTEFENVWFSHQLSRATGDNELRRKLALIRRSEQQQQKLLAHLKPAEETALEHTIGYEQLAVDLTAHLAKRVTDADIRDALDFALLEDFDHLYRYADYLDATSGVHAEELVGRYTEIMPGRPTISHHRHPYDSVRWDMGGKKPVTIDVLAANVITAAEQQTMNYYMNVASFYHTEWGRKMYGEIAMIEEEHVSGYESLKDPTTTWLECALMHEYAECYLYYSCYKTEKNEYLKSVYEEHFLDEVNHLKIISELLKKYDGKDFFEVMPETEFPDILNFKENKSYIREVLKSVPLTTSGDVYLNVNDLKPNNAFKKYQSAIIKGEQTVPSHRVMENYIKKHGEDLRYETAPHPIKELRDRKVDNVSVARP